MKKSLQFNPCGRRCGLIRSIRGLNLTIWNTDLNDLTRILKKIIFMNKPSTRELICKF